MIAKIMKGSGEMTKKPKVGVIKLKNGSTIYVSTSESKYKKVTGKSMYKFILDEDEDENL